MVKKIFLDIGSFTVKVYIFDGVKLQPLFTRSLHFKKGFNPESGISEANKRELFEIIHSINKTYPGYQVCAYATALFRKIQREARVRFVDEAFLETGVKVNIVSDELENFYLEQAVTGKAELKERVLLVNLGGGSLELVVLFGDEAVETANVQYGISHVLEDFPHLNDEVSPHTLRDVVESIKTKLPVLNNMPMRIGFYTGGLTYMRVAHYRMRHNTLFNDPLHPCMAEFADFATRNEQIFSLDTMKELEAMMPNDPKWMHGARASSAIGQAIFEMYGVTNIIPSDANIIDGVINQEYRYVVLAGSFEKHIDYIYNIRASLDARNIHVLSPRLLRHVHEGAASVTLHREDAKTPLELDRFVMEALHRADALIVCDKDGYVGASALLKIGYAHSLGIPICFTEKPKEELLNTLPHQIISI